MSCSIGFFGPRVPSVTWNGPDNFNITPSEALGAVEGTVSSTLLIRVPPPPGIVGPFQCRVSFPSSVKSPDLSRKFIDVTASCKSNLIKVH
jgi:hypothetical protein